MADDAHAAGGGRRGVLGTLAAIVIVVAGLKIASGLVVPVLLATLIALVCVPPVRALERAGAPGWLAMLVVLVVVALALLLLSSIVGTSVRDFNAALPAYAERLEVLADAWLVPVLRNRPDVQAQLASLLDPGRLLGLIGNTTTAVLGLLSSTVVILLIAAFMVVEARGLPDKLRRAIGGPDADISRYEGIARMVFEYLSIKAVLSALTGVLAWAIVAAAGVDFPLLWGLVAFLFNFVPNIGSIIAAVPPVLLALVQHGVGVSVAVAVGYLVLNLGIGTLLEPRIMGRRLGLSTLVVFLSLMLWGWVLGPVGMLLSVPLTMIVKIVCESRDDLRFVAILLGPAGERVMAPHPRDDDRG